METDDKKLKVEIPIVIEGRSNTRAVTHLHDGVGPALLAGPLPPGPVLPVDLEVVVGHVVVHRRQVAGSGGGDRPQ